MRNLFFLFVVFSFVSCKQKTTNKESGSEMKVIPKSYEAEIIDVHTHFQKDRNYFNDFMENRKMKTILVDVAKHNPTDSTQVERSWDDYVALAEKHPDLFWLCSSLMGVGIDSPDFAQNEIERLKKEIAQGAKMVKVWKNFGMVTKDNSGKYIQIDDQRLQPIWNFLKEQNIPVMAHIAEPVQAWRPLNPNSPHFGYYSEHPEYHAYNFPKIPSYETIIAARDNWIANNPDLQILCAHVGSMSHDVAMVAQRLDSFPNMKVELAARFGDLATQDSKKVRTFFEKYQDRILFGTDFGNNGDQNNLSAEELAAEQEELAANYDRLHAYLSTSDSVLIRGQANVGLSLPKEVLQKIYATNIKNFLNLK
ncbi:Predicted metal-dependent hydrolase, TIM-barrel fold [Maribacter orientalis]|uniref:Predicted metal-dependent hydrolase, TIM-barrel fold n=1 Tax=Maribacter orientalis TaxID=228957 RepID=A0A1H7F4X8_9FLAO|nr:amidohydrolase family protein [Maribacter orientalis]SEK21038.1 Predicted metal-dependent hydrolase, TIM-barrel fold [Maribacter orientalis]